jgi:uncharacterized protein YdiU (UPF0061 family)
MTAGALFPFENTYAGLPDRFFARLDPTPVAAPRLLKLNEALARDLGLEPASLATPEGVAVLAGNRVATTSVPIAMAYAGHQFGSFVPQLGDGRALLLGEVVDRGGVRRDVQLKGSGPTPFSRRGDGRAAVGPVLREYIVSEAMAALGIPTTRSLAAVATGETVWRETGLPGAVLTRVAASHVRVGTFQYFAARADNDGLRRLADYVIARLYPDLAGADAPYRALLESVAGRQAELVARWLAIGFIHGVMNTDNCSVAGETIDYGPCAFMDTFHPGQVYSSIDQMGRYAYANQPRIALWNVTRFAETLLPLLAEDEKAAVGLAEETLAGFAPRFEAAYAAAMRAKLGLAREEADDMALARDLLDRMTKGAADYTGTFRALCRVAEESGEPAGSAEADRDARAHFAEPALFDDWAERWRARAGRESRTPAERAAAMRRTNPAYIPRNHLVEEALAAAAERDDLGPFETLLDVLARPFEEQPGRERHALGPRPDEVVQQTFCGT